MKILLVLALVAAATAVPFSAPVQVADVPLPEIAPSPVKVVDYPFDFSNFAYGQDAAEVAEQVPASPVQFVDAAQDSPMPVNFADAAQESVSPVDVAQESVLPVIVVVVANQLNAAESPIPLNFDAAEVVPSPVKVVDFAAVAPSPVKVVEFAPAAAPVAINAEEAASPVQVIDFAEAAPSPINFVEVADNSRIPVVMPRQMIPDVETPQLIPYPRERYENAILR